MKKTLRALLIAAAWLAIWQAASMLVGQELLIPSPAAVLARLWALCGQGAFWKSVLLSMGRILLGYLSGLALGLILGGATAFCPALGAFLSPLLAIIRSTPVASFIILVLVWLATDSVPVFTALLMVLGVAWGNVSQGFASTDPGLLEMAKLYRLSRWQKLRYLYLPSMRPYFSAAALSSIGLAWKAGIAAEVICRPQFSIGRELYESKIYLEMPDLFAWTIAIILLSMALEQLFRRFLARRGA